MNDVLGTRRGTRKAQGQWPQGPVAAGGGPFNPTSLIGTQGAFWRADVGVTAPGGNVSAWADQGSHGNNLSVLGTPVQTAPNWTSTNFNTSFPGVEFDAGGVTPSDGLGTSSVVLNSTTLSIFLLLTSITATASTRFWWDFVASAGNEYSTPSVTLAPDGSGLAYYYSSGKLTNSAGDFTFAEAAPQVFGLILDGAAAQAYVNFATQGAAGSFSSTIGTSGAGNFGLGFSPSAGSAKFVCAYCLVTNNVLAAGDITNLKSWTNANWGTSF